MEKLIKSVLYEIAEKTYNKKPRSFDVHIIPEERKSFHGQYWPDKKLIEVFNLSRPTEFVISTTIHELAHHIAYTEYSNLKHDKQFYKIFKELLETSVKLGYVNYDKVREKTDSLDIQQMEKYHGKITAKYDASMDSNKDYSLIKVFNSYEIKDELSKIGYFFNSTEKLHQKKVHNNSIEKEKGKLLKISENIKYEILPFNNFNIKVYYYVVVEGDTYNHKEELKNNGYIFNGYYQKNNKWIKKIEAKKIDDEALFLKSLNLSYIAKSSFKKRLHN